MKKLCSLFLFAILALLPCAFAWGDAYKSQKPFVLGEGYVRSFRIKDGLDTQEESLQKAELEEWKTACGSKYGDNADMWFSDSNIWYCDEKEDANSSGTSMAATSNSDSKTNTDSKSLPGSRKVSQIAEVTGFLMDANGNGVKGAKIIVCEDKECTKTGQQETSGRKGKFTLKNVKPDAFIMIKPDVTKYLQKIVSVTENMGNIKLESAEDSDTGKSCDTNDFSGVWFEYAGDDCKADVCKKCVPTKCKNNGYIIKDNKCFPCDLETDTIIKSVDSDKCEITECDVGYNISEDKKTCVKKETGSQETEEESKDEKKETYDPEKLAKAEKAYEDAKANEQSLANRTLTAATTAATGIGGMQLAQGLSEQKADEAAAADMAAYIATFRCEYANGKSVKAGPEEIELPGGNNQNLMNYRAEYIALAKDLKERKAALGMKAGIESEEILDKANSGLYDDENIGITSGGEASLYRAQMLNSETDQAKLDDMASTSSKRVKGGAIAAGAGAVGGVLGNSLVNGGLGDKLKELFNNENFGTETRALVRKEETALNNLKKCLKSAGVSGTDDLSFTYFYPSVLSVSSMNCSRDLIIQPYYRDKSASDLFADSDDAEIVMDRMWTMFEPSTVGKLIGYGSTLSNKSYGTNHLRRKMQSVKDKYEKAESTDKSRALDLGINFNDILRDGVGLRNLFSGQSGFDLLGGSGVDMSSLSGFLNQ